VLRLDVRSMQQCWEVKSKSSLCIDFFPHYSGEHFFTSSVSFLTILFVIKLCCIHIDENLPLGIKALKV